MSLPFGSKRPVGISPNIIDLQLHTLSGVHLQIRQTLDGGAFIYAADKQLFSLPLPRRRARQELLSVLPDLDADTVNVLVHLVSIPAWRR